MLASGKKYYKAHGQVIKSDLILYDFIEIEESDLDYDINILQRRINKKLSANWFIKKNKKGHFLLYFKEVGFFRVNKEQVIYFSDGGALRDLSHLYICGLVMGACLLAKGLCVMHASAVTNGKGMAIMFVGSSGAGKSSIVAGLIDENCKLLSDDMVVLNPSDDIPKIAHGKMRLQITKEIAQRLFANCSFEEKSPFKNKYYLRCYPDGNELGSRLKGIYFIEPTDGPPEIAPLAKADAVFRLLGNSMKSRFFETTEKEIRYFSRLVKKIPSYVLRRSNRLDEYFLTRNMLVSHMNKYFFNMEEECYE